MYGTGPLLDLNEYGEWFYWKKSITNLIYWGKG
jgi:hypothetical protein